jgi:hypothetical protein
MQVKSISGSFIIKQTLNVKRLKDRKLNVKKLNVKKLNVRKSLNLRMRRFKKRCILMRR